MPGLGSPPRGCDRRRHARVSGPAPDRRHRRRPTPHRRRHDRRTPGAAGAAQPDRDPPRRRSGRTRRVQHLDRSTAGEPNGAGRSIDRAPQRSDAGRGVGGEGAISGAPAVATGRSDRRQAGRVQRHRPLARGVASSHVATPRAGRSGGAARRWATGPGRPQRVAGRHDMRSIGSDVPGPLALAFGPRQTRHRTGSCAPAHQREPRPPWPLIDTGASDAPRPPAARCSALA